VIITLTVITLCICNNKKSEGFCSVEEYKTNKRPHGITGNLDESYRNMSGDNILTNINDSSNIIIGVLDESVKNMSGVNMVKNVVHIPNIYSNIIMNNNYGKMKATYEPDFPNYDKL
jgi:hypothetical protein